MKVDNIQNFSDEEIDYIFGLAKTAGAKAICRDALSVDEAAQEFLRTSTR